MARSSSATDPGRMNIRPSNLLQGDAVERFPPGLRARDRRVRIAVLAVILVMSPNRRLAALQKTCRAAGKLTAMFGARYNEYSVVHGE